MPSKRSRLDRFISRHSHVKMGDVRLMLAKNRVRIDGKIATDRATIVNQFSRVSLDNNDFAYEIPYYYMLNKPKGVVCATHDSKHATVIDLLHTPNKHLLHISGRLDFNSSGLVLLTNNGEWSRQLSLPNTNVAKRYRVTLEKPLDPQYISTFRSGIYFRYENITTRPALLTIISPFIAELTITEGRYHQIKRMFGYFQNKVLELHRISVGSISLDTHLKPGDSRSLSEYEVETITKK